MRDLHLRHTLTTLARDASGVFSDLVEGGQEIPYEIGEAGDGFAFCQYRPLTARFVRDNATELRELETYREATATMRKVDIAGPYLEEAGIAPPADPVDRADLAVTYFLARLWDGCGSFEIDDERFAAAIAEIEECGEPEAGEVEAIVPLIGFQMPVSRLELSGAAIVRADAVDVPSEAARGERPGGASWEPTFLISARVALDDDGGLGGAGDRVARRFESVVTTLRLHKPGGVGLGPHGWVRVAGDRWRRIATGSGKPRPGGYRLAESELDRVADLARAVAVHPRRVARLRRALLRFEAGLDRRGAVDALNDHLLALRFLLEGEGPAGVGLPMRVAALAEADDDRRGAVKEAVERAVALERELWSGEPAPAGAAQGPAEIAGRVEELLRTILRRGVSGEIGSDFRAAADEALLADGLAIGEGSPSELGGDTEWELEEVEELEASVPGTEPEPATDELDLGFDRDGEEIHAARIAPGRHDSDGREQGRRQIHLPLIVPAEDDGAAEEEIAAGGPAAFQDEQPEPEPSPVAAGGWLDEVDDGATMDFPRRPNHLRELSRPPLDRDEVRARVEYLFPRTETNWTVGRGGNRAAG